MKKSIYFVVCVLIGCSSPDAETYYRQGRASREAGEPVAAMKSFIAATQVRSHEYGYKGRSYSNMATMCRMCERHDLAYKVYALSAEQFLQAGDSTAYAYALNNMAWEQAITGNKAAAMSLADSAMHICSSGDVPAKVAETRAAACLYAEEYDSVLCYTQKSPMNPAYFDILRAQAYTFSRQNDSALFYARRVTAETDNPRYLDDAYYILTHCDTTAAADDIRALASARADIQRTLERNDPEWTQAVLMAEEALLAPANPVKRLPIAAVAGVVLCALGLVLYIRRAKRRRHSMPPTEFDRQCSELRRSPQLRTDLQWYDYNRFCEVCNTRLSGIADKLARRGLAEREIRICVLVMIGLSYAEIASILYRAESGIGKDKYMIAKRLGVRVKDLQATLRAIACSNDHA